MEVGDVIFLGVYFYYTVLSYSIDYCFSWIYFEFSIKGLFSEFRFCFGFMKI